MKPLLYFLIFFSLLLIMSCAEDKISQNESEGVKQDQIIFSIDETVSVSPGSYRAWLLSGSIIGDTLEGSITSDSDVNLFFLSEREYRAFEKNESFYPLPQSRYRILSYNFSFDIPNFGAYYIVLDNTFSIITKKIVHISAKLIR